MLLCLHLRFAPVRAPGGSKAEQRRLELFPLRVLYSSPSRHNKCFGHKKIASLSGAVFRFVLGFETLGQMVEKTAGIVKRQEMVIKNDDGKRL